MIWLWSDDVAGALATGSGTSGGVATVIRLLAKVRTNFDNVFKGSDCTCFNGCVVWGAARSYKQYKA